MQTWRSRRCNWSTCVHMGCTRSSRYACAYERQNEAPRRSLCKHGPASWQRDEQVGPGGKQVALSATGSRPDYVCNGSASAGAAFVRRATDVRRTTTRLRPYDSPAEAACCCFFFARYVASRACRLAAAPAAASARFAAPLRCLGAMCERWCRGAYYMACH